MADRIVVVAPLLLFLGLSSRAPAAEHPIVAVFAMEDRGSELDPATLANLTDYLATHLTEGGYRVIPRSQVQQRLRAQKTESYKKCYDQSCQIEMGRELAAQKTLASQVLKVGKTCHLTAMLYDLRKATTELAATAESACEEEALMQAVRTVADKLCKPLSEGDISTEAARETVQIMDRLEQLRKQKEEMERAARQAEQKRKAEEERERKLRLEADRAKQEAALAKKEAELARREAEAARREAEEQQRRADQARLEARTTWERFVDSLQFEIQAHVAGYGLEGNQYCDIQDGSWHHMIELDGTTHRACISDARLGGGIRAGMRFLDYHAVFIHFDYLQESWDVPPNICNTGGGYPGHIDMDMFRLVAGYRFAFPVLSWLEPYIELAVGAHLYLGEEVLISDTGDCDVDPDLQGTTVSTDHRFALMLGGGLRFPFLDHFFFTGGILWDIPVSEVPTTEGNKTVGSSSILLGFGAYF